MQASTHAVPPLQDMNDDSDPDSDEAQNAAPANWVSGQVQERRTRFPSVSSSNIPATTAGSYLLRSPPAPNNRLPLSLSSALPTSLRFFADKRRTQRTQSMRPRNSLPVSKRATVAFDQGVTFHDEKVCVSARPGLTSGM